MFGLGLFARGESGRPDWKGRAPAKGRRVIILGGGIAGLATAYELRRLGYDCHVLEARRRPGGRNWTLRGGTEETEIGGDRQVCKFDSGLFLNAGPMRIAHHHVTTLGYCRELGVPLVVFTNVNEAAYIHRDGFPRQRMREVRSDWRGYTAELLAKVARQGQLDAPLTAEDREKLIEYLRLEGRLDANLIYARDGAAPLHPPDAGNARGYMKEPAAADEEVQPSRPMDLEQLVKAGYASSLNVAQDYNQQATMLTPAGGMDRLPYALAANLGDAVQLGAKITEIRRRPQGGVRVGYMDMAHRGALREITGDYCVCTLPPGLLARIPADFSPEVMAALPLAKPSAAGKIGLQFKRRFWEEDDQIYGGLSQTDQPITQIGYPFDGYGSRGKGVLLGYYHFGNSKAELDDQPVAERQRRALAQGAKIHPQYTQEFENSFSVAWHRIPFNEMSWSRWATDDDFVRTQHVLGKADGPFYFAGDWLSHFNAWQAGAIGAAQRVCGQLHARALAS